MGPASAPEEASGAAASTDAHTRDRWRWLDQVAADQELTPFAFKVAYVIASYVSRETGDAWPGQARIAAKAGGTDRGVRNAIDALQARGHLQVDRRQGRKDTNRYRMAIEYRNHRSGDGPEYRNGGSGSQLSEAAADPISAPDHRNGGSGSRQVDRNRGSGNEPEYRNGGSSLTGTAVPLIPLRETFEGDAYTPPQIVRREGGSPKRSTPDADFAEFWAAVPLQRDEVDTRRAYDKVVRTGRATHLQLMSGIVRYAAEREGKDQQFTKHPANWIKGGCWTDTHHAPSMLLPINGGKHDSTSASHTSQRPRSGGASAMSGIAAVRAKHMGVDR